MIIWNQIDTVLLDMDGTLLDLHFDNYFWREYLPLKWGELNKLDPAAARERLYAQLQGKEGTLSWYCLDYWSEQLNLDVLGLKADLRHLVKERPNAREFLQFLAGMGKSLAMVTNAHQALIDMKFDCTSLGQHFEHVFCAHQIGYPKEDARFWDELRNVYPFDPARTLLIDDNYAVLTSAKNWGIQHLLTIAQPDSSQSARQDGDFLAIGSFLELTRL